MELVQCFAAGRLFQLWCLGNQEWSTVQITEHGHIRKLHLLWGNTILSNILKAEWEECFALWQKEFQTFVAICQHFSYRYALQGFLRVSLDNIAVSLTAFSRSILLCSLQAWKSNASKGSLSDQGPLFGHCARRCSPHPQHANMKVAVFNMLLQLWQLVAVWLH